MIYFQHFGILISCDYEWEFDNILIKDMRH